MSKRNRFVQYKNQWNKQKWLNECSNLHFKKLKQKELPSFLPSDWIDKCNSGILISSGTTELQVFSVVGFRKDGDKIDEHPYVVAFDNRNGNELSGFIEHANYDGRTTDIPKEIVETLQANGISSDISFNRIPEEQSGTIQDLIQKNIINGFFNSLNIVHKNLPTMNFQNLLFNLSNGILTITINRPDKLNALNKLTVQEIGQAIQEAKANAEVKVIIITGSGVKGFVAGADISEFVGLSVEQGKAMAKAGQDVFKSIEDCPKPVIAAVNGFALGGGCELAMACHLRVASENAKFGQPEVNLGLIAGYGGTQRLIQLIGKTKAMELHLTGDMITAEQALFEGLVNYVVPQDQLLARCTEIAERIKSKSPKAVAGAIAAINAYFAEGVDGYKAEIDEFGKCFSSEDFKEGTSAFLEKRKANFTGK